MLILEDTLRLVDNVPVVVYQGGGNTEVRVGIRYPSTFPRWIRQDYAYINLFVDLTDGLSEFWLWEARVNTFAMQIQVFDVPTASSRIEVSCDFRLGAPDDDAIEIWVDV